MFILPFFRNDIIITYFQVSRHSFTHAWCTISVILLSITNTPLKRFSSIAIFVESDVACQRCTQFKFRNPFFHLFKVVRSFRFEFILSNLLNTGDIRIYVPNFKLKLYMSKLYTKKIHFRFESEINLKWIYVKFYNMSVCCILPNLAKK